MKQKCELQAKDIGKFPLSRTRWLLSEFALSLIAFLLLTRVTSAQGDQAVKPQTCTPIPAGVVSFWRAENNAADSAGNNNGVLQGNAAYSQGMVGTAFVFDGNRDGVMVGTGTNLHLQNFTIEGWIKRASKATLSFNGNSNACLLAVGTDPGGLGITLRQSDGCLMLTKSTSVWENTEARVADTSWHHIAVTKQDRRVVIYIDGRAFPTRAFDLGPFAFNAPAFIGGWLNRAGLVDNSFYGAIDELTVYVRELTAGEIATIYYAGGGKCPGTNMPPECSESPSGLLSWWRADDHTFDSVSANHGSLVGTASYGNGRVGKGFLLTQAGAGIHIRADTSLQLQDFSIEAWLKRANPAGRTNDSNSMACIFSQGCDGGGFGFYLRRDDSLALGKLQVNEVASAARITDTNWHHVVVTKSGPTVVFYVDARAYPAARYDSGGFVFHGPTYIGTRMNLFNQVEGSFQGIIDEVGFYNRSLAAVEVLKLFNAGSAGKCSIPAPPAVLTQPLRQTVTEGDAIMLKAAFTGCPPLSYQWHRYGINITGAYDDMLVLPAAQSADSGIYSVRATNSFGSVTSSNIQLTVNPLPDCTVVPAGVVNWWRAENNTADELCSTDGTMLSNAGFASGKVGGALTFNGNNQHVRFSNSPSLNPPDALTLECWVYVEQYPTNDCVTIASKEDLSPRVVQHQYGLGLVNYTGEWVVGIQVELLGGLVMLEGRTRVSLRHWHHVAMTYDGSTLRVYLNGNLDVTAPATGLIKTSTAPFQIGGHSRGPWNLNGRVDELSLYHRALTPAEIRSIYNAGGAGKCPIQRPVNPLPSGLIGWWAGESNSVDSVHSNSATAVNGLGYAPGKIGTAFAFNGKNQLLLVTNSASLNPTNGFTIETWVFVEQLSTNGWMGIVVTDDRGVARRQLALRLAKTGDRWAFRAIVGLVKDEKSLVGGAPVAPRTWYHVATTYDGSALRFFVNGVLDGELSASGPLMAVNGVLTIGDDGSLNPSFNGRLDEVCLYDRPLSPREIAASYLAGSTGKALTDARPSTRDLRRWLFEEGQARMNGSEDF